MRSLRVIGSLALLALVATAPARAQPAPDEAGVRAALAACVAAWNRHVPKAFGDVCLTEDVWFSETNDSFYRRFQGREKFMGSFGYNVEKMDLQWDVVRIRALPDGTAAVQLKQRVGVLPKKQGRYASTFDSDPSFARLRREGGAWRIFFFTSHQGWSLALLKELDAPPPSAPALTTTPAALARVPPGTEPPAYSTFFGDRTQSCFFCHGKRPSQSDDPRRWRIVPTGAAAADAAALRRTLLQAHAGGPLGGIVERSLADPALDNEQLDAIRLWLRAMRDGRAERMVDRIVIHSERSERDPPARLALLRAEGGWSLPADAGCHQGATLQGASQCEIRLPPGTRGALVFRFAASEGLQPQEVRLMLE